MGSMQVREGLPKNRAFIAMRTKLGSNMNTFDDCDRYIVIKLMSFTSKMEKL